MPCTGSVAGAAGCRRHRGAPQRCCRIRAAHALRPAMLPRRAKHLASSINDARLTRSGAAMAASAPSRVASSILLLPPQRLPGSPSNIPVAQHPDPEKSHQELFQTRADAASLCRQIETSRRRGVAAGTPGAGPGLRSRERQLRRAALGMRPPRRRHRRAVCRPRSRGVAMTTCAVLALAGGAAGFAVGALLVGRCRRRYARAAGRRRTRPGCPGPTRRLSRSTAGRLPRRRTGRP